MYNRKYVVDGIEFPTDMDLSNYLAVEIDYTDKDINDLYSTVSKCHQLLVNYQRSRMFNFPLTLVTSKDIYFLLLIQAISRSYRIWGMKKQTTIYEVISIFNEMLSEQILPVNSVNIPVLLGKQSDIRLLSLDSIYPTKQLVISNLPKLDKPRDFYYEEFIKELEEYFQERAKRGFNI